MTVAPAPSSHRAPGAPAVDVFVSYKREDEARAARLVVALEAHGLSVWWDRQLPPGENWRDTIDEALAEARTAVVVWTEGSVGPMGAYVRSEARQAAREHKLVPVLMDAVLPPKGLDEIQAVDLTHWNGSTRDTRVIDLVTAIRAKMAAGRSPPARAAEQRWRRKLAWATAASALAAALALVADVSSIAATTCGLPFAQPALADACGGLGIGGKPSRQLREAWEGRPRGDCAWLEAYVRNPTWGPYAAEAGALLQLRRAVPTGQVEIVVRDDNAGYVRQSAEASKSEAEAKARAMTEAQADAEDVVCRPTSPQEKLKAAEIKPVRHICSRPLAGGHACALDYRATCVFERPAFEMRCG